ncbi:MAG: BlaI/MecI/CopY family transcriptional regulator, partial [Acidobacteriaceae bacterium]
MKTPTPQRHNPAELGELESSILSIVWREASVTAEEVREGLERRLTDSTVRTMLRRLE